MGRASNTDERRAQIVAAMARVVARNGYEGASIGEIARATKLASGLVHYHFENKREILLELIATLHAQHRGRLDRALETPSETPGTRLDVFVDVHLAVGPDSNTETVACWVAIAAEAVRDPIVRDAYQRVVQDDLGVLESIIRNSLQHDGLSARGTKAIAAAIFAAIQGCFVLAVASPDTIPPGSAARTVRQMAAGLLRGAHAD
jgi:TetR/AcrR family transcriptional repressor of bet genes